MEAIALGTIFLLLAYIRVGLLWHFDGGPDESRPGGKGGESWSSLTCRVGPRSG